MAVTANSPQKMNNSPFSDVPVSKLFDEPRAICIASFVELSKGRWDLQWDSKTLEKILRHERHANKKLISICTGGSARTGKSKWSNFVLALLKKLELHEPVTFLDGKSDGDPFEGYINGFKWGSGHKPLTDGILMWSLPTLLKDSHGREVVVLLFDCEGINMGRRGIQAVQDKSLDAQLFTICCAISSIKVYNINGVINQQNLDSFLSATNYGVIINGKAAPFQNLILLRRNCEFDEAGFDNEKISLDEFVEKDEYRELVSNPNVNVFNLPVPNRAIAGQSKEFREKLLNGQCTIDDIGPIFLHYIAEQFKLMIPIDQSNGHIDDRVLKAKILDNGKVHNLNCEEFFYQIKNIFETFRNIKFKKDQPPKDFPSMWAAICAKSAGITHMKLALARNEGMKGANRMDLCEINDFYAKHIVIALNLYKMVHWWCCPEKPGQKEGFRGSLGDFTSQGNALFTEIKKLYKVSVESNENKPTSFLEYCKSAALGSGTGGGITGLLYAFEVSLIVANPIAAVIGIGAAGVACALGFNLVKKYAIKRNSPNFVELLISEMIKDRALESLYAFKVDMNLTTKEYKIWDEQGKLKCEGQIEEEICKIMKVKNQ